MSATENTVSVCFAVQVEAYPGALSRVLEPFAKRDLTPDYFRSAREGEVLRIDIAMEAMPAGMVHLVAGNIGQIVGVRHVLVEQGEMATAAAA
ncbi:hypothetical protein IAI18_21835 [Acetobacteraceae bacterium H6797]|nr:hypothetical protein [Acetobacteraceae bacterium H6797]